MGDAANKFLNSLDTPLSPLNPVVMKPPRAAGSMGVTKVTSMEDAKDAFDLLNKEIVSPLIFKGGRLNDNDGMVLVQEFMNGPEYVFDSVSQDGIHKTVAIWRYDKRATNDNFNSYFSFDTINATGELAETIIAYGNKVLDAVGIWTGASHMEIKILEGTSEPCLVEVGARRNGIAALVDLENAVLGTNQINATVSAYLRPVAFAAMPTTTLLRQHGSCVYLHVYQHGVLEGIPGIKLVRKLKSYLTDTLVLKVGDIVSNTAALNNSLGAIALAHDDLVVVEADKAYIHQLCTEGLFFDLRKVSA